MRTSSRTEVRTRRTKIAARGAIAVVLVTAGLVGTAGAASAATSGDTLQAAAQQGVANGYPGVIGLVEQNGTVTTVSSGVGNRSTNAAADPTALFRIGSVTKTFIAADMLLLESQGRLSMNDTVDRWLPGVVNANGNDGTKITIRELLDMTSGLPEYLDKVALSDWTSTTRYTPPQLVNLALTSSPTSAPGAAVNYTNTAYILAGMIIQKVTGNDPSVEVTNDIIKPLGLTNTSFPTNDNNLYGNYLHGYFLTQSWIGTLTYTDVTASNPTLTWAAGAMVSTEQDLATFYRALFTGKLLPAAQLTEMETGVHEPGAADNYFDLGIETIATPCGPMYAKNGGVPGYANFAASSGDGSKQVMIAGNEDNLHPGNGFWGMFDGLKNAYCAS